MENYKAGRHFGKMILDIIKFAIATERWSDKKKESKFEPEVGKFIGDEDLSNSNAVKENYNI